MHILAIFALVAALSATPSAANAAVYMEYEGVPGETAASGTAAVTTATIAAPAAVSISGVVGKPFVLDGSRSIDDGAISRFVWMQVSGPRGAQADLTEKKASVVPPAAGTYVFELRVTDAAGRTSVAQTVSVAVSAAAAAESAPAVVAPPSAAPEPAAADVFIKLPPIEGDSGKAQEAPGTMTDVTPDAQPLTPDFSILLGGGSDDDEAANEGRAKAAEVLLQGMAEQGAPAETLSLNYEKIKTTVKQPLKLFGLFTVQALTTVEIDAEEKVTVRYPWWGFLASGKDAATVGERVRDAVANVLKTKHDTVKNAIGNIR